MSAENGNLDLCKGGDRVKWIDPRFTFEEGSMGLSKGLAHKS